MEFLPQWASELSGWGVVTLCVVALLTGHLTTRREVNAEKTRADTWQAAWQAERVANQEKDAQQAELVENSRITVRLLRALQAVLDNRRPGSEDAP